jgi:hypothetical protein
MTLWAEGRIRGPTAKWVSVCLRSAEDEEGGEAKESDCVFRSLNFEVSCPYNRRSVWEPWNYLNSSHLQAGVP